MGLANEPILRRYEIEGDASAWADAEKSVAKSAAQNGEASGVTVSIKSGKSKRKAGQQTAAEVYEEAFGEKRSKKAKKAKKDKGH